jgi:hypothetical protein
MKKTCLMQLFLVIFFLSLTSQLYALPTQIYLKTTGVDPRSTGTFHFGDLGNINVYYGEYDLAIDWDMTGPAGYQAISGFCVEDAWATSSNNVIYNLLLPSAAGPQYIAAAYILGQYQAGNISAQAAQIAVWETVMDFNNLSYESGHFYAINPDSNDLAYINSASSFLTTMYNTSVLDSFDSTSYRIARNGDNPSDGYQDYVIHVPEPGALLSLGIVLLGLGGVARRRFKR